LKQRNRRGSDSSIRSSQQYEPLIKVNTHASKRDTKMSLVKPATSNNNDENLKYISLSKKLTNKRKKKNQDDEEDDDDYDV
jgi:hypothetical protein